MIKTILEKPKISAKEMREFLEAEYEKSPNWEGWAKKIDFYRKCGMGKYADRLIETLDLDEVLDK